MFIRDLTVLDCAVLDPQRGPVGYSYLIDAEVIGGLDHEGVVFDFSHAKKTIKKVIDDLCDHRLIVLRQDVAHLDDAAAHLDVALGQLGRLQYTCPAQGLCILDADAITPATIAAYLEQKVMEKMPPNVTEIRLTCQPEIFASEQPIFHYTHGLKQHYGNCQRLLHGHNNKLDILVDGRKNGELEHRIAQEWQDVHFAFPENIRHADLRIGARQDHITSLTIAYAGNQGRFSATLPGSCVYLLPYETTVENISRHLADKVRGILKSQGRQGTIEVFAYEGIRKGAATRL